MVKPSGYIQLDHAVASVMVGHRQRRDLGDLTELADSIRDLGMLQPITISPDGVLICGARRLAAVKQLGWPRVNVWVRAGISTPLQRLLAEQHDNTLHKPFTPTEAASLYQELKTLMAEEAARRKIASQFGSDTDTRPGSAESAEPSDLESRAQAARLVTGHKSYTRFEQVLQLQRLAADPETNSAVRKAATSALASIDIDGKVNGHYQRFRATQASTHGKSPPTCRPSTTDGPGCHNQTDVIIGAKRHDGAVSEATRGRHRLRAFLLVLEELSGWTTDHDPEEIGPALTQKQWTELQDAISATVKFIDAAGDARET